MDVKGFNVGGFVCNGMDKSKNRALFIYVGGFVISDFTLSII
jgi:hypothetical protein